jgi:hypothetical protein
VGNAQRKPAGGGELTMKKSDADKFNEEAA